MRLIHRTANNQIVIKEREQFLSRIAVLMEEGYLMPTALALLLPLHTQKAEEALTGVTGVLKAGGTAAEIFRFLGFKDRVLFPVEIAEYHGRLAESIDSIARSFARTEQLQKKLKGILIYPVSLLIFTAILFLFFRTNYVPNLTELMVSMRAEENAQVPVYLLNLPDFFIAFFLSAAGAVLAFRWILKRQPVPRQIDWLLSIPVVGGTMRLYWSQLLAKELGTLLHSGISLQESLHFLEKQNYHSVIRFLAASCKKEVVMGQPLSTALNRFSFFAEDMPSFAQHGETAGYLGKELLLYSELLMERIERQTQQLLRIIQPVFFIIIALCIVGAYLAILLPMYNLVQTI